MILQLNPPLPVLTPKGAGVAHFLIDYSAEFNLMWTVFLDDTGECWTFDNQQIRACKNATLGRHAISAIKNCQAGEHMPKNNVAAIGGG
jgi:hypothetical protein